MVAAPNGPEGEEKFNVSPYTMEICVGLLDRKSVGKGKRGA